jgi:alkylhydroperoxidase/carboxymuconolactone decarboxylase family protein YurZ
MITILSSLLRCVLEVGFQKYGAVFHGISREEILILIFVFDLYDFNVLN